jgi:uncharacterized protein
MPFSPSQLADFAVTALVFTAQILIARLLFTAGKRQFSPRVFRIILSFMCVLWFMVAMESILGSSAMTFRTRWIPAPFRGTLVAVGNLWGMLSAASLAFYYVYRFFARRLSPAHSPARRGFIHAAGTVAVAAPFAVAAFGAIVERTNFQVKEVDLPIPGLHPDLEGLRIGQLSDLHISPWLSVRQAGRAVDMLNELKPHLTVITGDLITQVGDPLDETIRELARLRADLGLLGCLGNHEVYARCQNYTTREAARYGIDMLRGSSRLLRWGNGVLNVSGVDFQRYVQRHIYLRDVEKLVVPGVTNLLLSHNPDVFPVAVRKGYDAMLAGHTHGGQVTVEIFSQTLNFARFVTPYVAGLYRLDGKSCYVTAGIGTIGMPVRLGVPPEITLARLRRA